MNVFKKVQKLILCQKKKFILLPPLKSKIFNKLPLLTIFQIFLIIDIIVSVFYIALGMILKGLFIFMAVIHLMYALLDLIIFNFHPRFDSMLILSIYLIKLYLVFVYQLSYYFICKHLLYLNYESLNNDKLDIIIIILKTIEDFSICYVTWSFFRRIRRLEKNTYLVKNK